MKEAKDRIFLVYSGLGKTTYCLSHPGVVDVDKGGFIGNHAALAKFAAFCLKKGYTVLASAHISVIREFKALGLPINIVIPSPERKQEILDTVSKRDNMNYYHHLLNCYDQEIDQIKNYPNPDSFIELKPGQYIDLILDE